mmetsp:Transcript_19049/g.31211  ORF Transcript_19049/g.31211 Transcript_19049/m.31211 type:complete len:353 (+) Transcript_19049:17-1075(+)
MHAYFVLIAPCSLRERERSLSYRRCLEDLHSISQSAGRARSSRPLVLRKPRVQNHFLSGRCIQFSASRPRPLFASFSGEVRCEEVALARDIESSSETVVEDSEPAIVVSDVCFSWERHAAAARASAGVSGAKTPSQNGSQSYKSVLRNVSLTIPRGQVWMLLGANGSGKSTLLQLFLGLVRPDSGTIRIRSPVGFVHQNPDHQVFMPTVGSDVAFGLAGLNLSHEELRTRVASALSLVGLAGYENRPVYTLSGGQKSRVAIAGSLVRDVNTILLDEPTAFLDPPQRQSLASHVRRIAKSTGISALWITHYYEELNHCDGAVVLDNGHVVCAGPPDEIRAYLKSNFDILQQLA